MELTTVRAACIGAASLLAAAWTGCAGAAEPGQGCSRPIRVAVSPAGRVITVSTEGAVGGWEAEFFDHIGARIACKFTYEVVTLARAHEMMKSAEIDVLPAAIRTEARDAYATFVRTSSWAPVLISISDRWSGIHTLRELASSGIRLDVIRGADYGAEYRALLMDPGIRPRLTETPNALTIARQLANGESDATLVTAPILVTAAETAGISDRVRISEIQDIPAQDGGEYVVERALSATDARLVEQGIADAVRRGEYDALVRRAFSGPAWVSAGYRGQPAKDR